MNQDQFEALAAWGEAVFANFPQAQIATAFSLPLPNGKADITYTAHNKSEEGGSFEVEGVFILKADGSVVAHLQEEDMAITADGVATFKFDEGSEAPPAEVLHPI